MNPIITGQESVEIDGHVFEIIFGIPYFGKESDKERVCISRFNGKDGFGESNCIYVRPLNKGDNGYFDNLDICNQALSKGEYTIDF